jgi:hypothetical protein
MTIASTIKKLVNPTAQDRCVVAMLELREALTKLESPSRPRWAFGASGGLSAPLRSKRVYFRPRKSASPAAGNQLNEIVRSRGLVAR